MFQGFAFEVTTAWCYRNSIIIIIIIIGIFLRKEKLMKKINVWNRHYCGWSDDKKPSCKSTALKRWIATEMR